MLEGEEDSRKEQTAMMEMRQDGLEVAESGFLDEECRSVLTQRLSSWLEEIALTGARLRTRLVPPPRPVVRNRRMGSVAVGKSTALLIQPALLLH